MKNYVSFLDAFEDECCHKGLDYVRVYQKADIPKDAYGRYRKQSYDPNYQFPRNRAIALCLALELPLDGIQEMLSYAGYALSPNVPHDRVVLEAIRRRDYNVVRLKTYMHDAGLKF